MKGLRKYISPFTPDQSGAVSVLFPYGGMIIIMDAGGCVGNICGFDEPRWTDFKSAIFSAGLRDLDAILGRDDLLIKKTKDALDDMDAKFVSLIGTPVPAVIATDYNALRRLMQKEYGLPVIPIETNGMDLYDKGAEKAYVKLFKEALSSDHRDEFIDNKSESFDIGMIGATPLDIPAKDSADELTGIVIENACGNPICYGWKDSLDAVSKGNLVKKNVVVSPSGVKLAKLLEEEYQIPYTVKYPIKDKYKKIASEKIERFDAKKILVVHQQIFANAIREIIEESSHAESVDVATWFMLEKEYGKENDIMLKEEDDFLKLVQERKYDLVIGDPLLSRALPRWNGKYASLPHFAVSGSLHSSDTEAGFWDKAFELI